MPCSCFGKKDKKGGVLGEEEKYRPRDSRERDPPAPAPAPVSIAPVTQSQSQPLLGGTPTPPPGTPPSPSLATPTPGGDARLRPEDDPDKATRRRDVVASFYSDECELIGFKATGSRPSSAHVGGQQDGGPAATSSPATSSPSSTRSGAFCRADLAEKRREFFRDLTLEDDDNSRGGSRPTSRLTDPGSQQTPRHSQYQDQLHHTLPHLHKTSPRSNKFSTTPLVVHHSLHRNSTSTPVSSSEETQHLLHSSPEQAPKKSPKKPDHSVSEIPRYQSNEVVSDSEIYLYDSDETPLLSEKETLPNILMKTESSVSSTFEQVSPEFSLNLADHSSHETREFVKITESKSPDLLVDISPTELNIDKTLVNNPEVNAIFPTEPTESSKLIIDSPSIEGQQFIYDDSTSENSKLFDLVLQESPVIVDSPSNANSQVPAFNISTSGSEEIKVNVPSWESPQNADHFAVDSQLIKDNDQVISGSPKVDPFAQFDSAFGVGSHSFESPQYFDNQFNVEFSQEPFPQTLPVIINETLKEHPKEREENTTFEITPQNTQMFFDGQLEQAPQTIVETTRQFISGSPDEQKTSQTIVETTRQFITGPPEEQTSQTILETTQQFLSGSPEEQNSSHTIVETTRQFISGINDDEERQNLLETAQQFFSGSPDEQTTVNTTQKIVSGDPDDQFTQTTVKTTIVSGNPDEQRTQTTVETTQQSLPTSVDPFFLTSVEEPDEFPEKLLQTATTTTTTVTHEKPVAMPRSHLDDVLEEEKEEPKLPDVPCFGAPPPPSSPPPPLPEGHFVEDPFTSPIAVVIPPGEEGLLPPAPPTPPAEQHQQAAPLFEEQQHQLEANTVPLTPSSPPIPHGEIEDLPPAPPTPPTPRVEDAQLLPSKPSPLENEQLPPTPPTPHREDELPPAPPTPPKKDHNKLAPGSSPTPPTITSSSPGVTCGVEIVSSSPLEDDGIGSEIDDAIETLEGLSEEGNIERAAASS